MIVGGVELDDKLVYTLAGLGVAIGLYASTQLQPQQHADTHTPTQQNSQKNKKVGAGKNKKKSKNTTPASSGSHESGLKQQQQQQPAKKNAQQSAQQPAQQPAKQPTQSKASKKKAKAAQQQQQQSEQPQQPQKPPTHTTNKLTTGEFNDVDSGEWTTINSKKKATTPTTEKTGFIEASAVPQEASSTSPPLDQDAWDRAPVVSAQSALNPDSQIYQDGDWTWSEKGGVSNPTNTFNTPLAESTLLQTHNAMDMLDDSLQPDQTHARVMRIAKDVKHTPSADDGWTMAGSKKVGVRDEPVVPPPQPQPPSQEEQTKKQRQNAKKKEAKAAVKSLNEKERQDSLRQHRQQQGQVQGQGVMKTSSKNPWEVLARRGDSDLIWD
ncbi:hypothetical protein E3P96_01568 [Wallemia ichthyophaga]|uniref:Uncharacterized protein n=1 Tax=Wallemia ichthyophaga TaxID=245174 RepID=A0A4T0J9W0_WALIC|nr:hypothetical protein E3P96_01568 [Wallemia ichthyophaga]TIB39720.1 hypothetical protein E3P86_00997 [Wallemia ichthyophaga]